MKIRITNKTEIENKVKNIPIHTPSNKQGRKWAKIATITKNLTPEEVNNKKKHFWIAVLLSAGIAMAFKSIRELRRDYLAQTHTDKFYIPNKDDFVRLINDIVKKQTIRQPTTLEGIAGLDENGFAFEVERDRDHIKALVEDVKKTEAYPHLIKNCLKENLISFSALSDTFKIENPDIVKEHISKNRRDFHLVPNDFPEYRALALDHLKTHFARFDEKELEELKRVPHFYEIYKSDDFWVDFIFSSPEDAHFTTKNPVTMLEAVKINGLFLEKGSVEIKDNEEIVRAAIAQNPESIKFASERLKNMTVLQ